MKKIYLSAFAIALAFNSYSQVIFTENFDNYSPGDVVGQSPVFDLWPGGTSSQVSTAQANSGANSMYTRDNLSDDVLLLLGDRTSGVYTVQWDMYVPGGASGFYNFQETEDVTVPSFAGQVFLGVTDSSPTGGAPNTMTFDFTPETVAYLSDFWFTLTHVIDLDNSTITISIDGTEVLSTDYVQTAGTPSTALGAIDFYSVDANHQTYVDNIIFGQGLLSTQSFDVASFSVYPNPVSDILNIQSKDVVSTISVYNVLGKLVYQNAPNTVSPTVNMGAFKSGVYFVEVTIGNATKTVKVIR